MQDDGYAFSNVADLLSAMDPSFNIMLERSLEAGLKHAGVSKLFIEELAHAIMRVNYGQSPDAHQFVGMCQDLILKNKNYKCLFFWWIRKCVFSWSRNWFVVTSWW